MAITPKYMDIVNWTTEQIANGEFLPKDKFLSEMELKNKFNCSRQTVRHALELLEQSGHINRIQGSGTYISCSKRSSSEGREFSMTLGLVSTFLDNYIFPSIIRGIEGVLSERGYGLQMSSTNNLVAGETRALQHMLGRQLDGLIVEPTRSALPCVNIDLYNIILQRNIPLVFIDSFYPELSTPYVALDDEKAGYVATQHLITMGHENILGVFPHNNRQGHLRYLGYVKALAHYKIEIQEDYICWYSNQNTLHSLLSNQFSKCLSLCTASLCFNDLIGMLLIDYLRQKGKSVPEDFSVVGIDNSELAKVCYLTSVAHPAEQLGESAAKLLISIINGSDGKNILFKPHLVTRSSVKKL